MGASLHAGSGAERGGNPSAGSVDSRVLHAVNASISMPAAVPHLKPACPTLGRSLHVLVRADPVNVEDRATTGETVACVEANGGLPGVTPNCPRVTEQCVIDGCLQQGCTQALALDLRGCGHAPDPPLLIGRRPGAARVGLRKNGDDTDDAAIAHRGKMPDFGAVIASELGPGKRLVGA